MGVLAAGLNDGRRGPRSCAPADEAAVDNLGTEFVNTHSVSQGTFQAALDQLGAQGLTELTTLMGYYALLAFNTNTFEIDLPEAPTEAVLPI